MWSYGCDCGQTSQIKPMPTASGTMLLPGHRAPQEQDVRFPQVLPESLRFTTLHSQGYRESHEVTCIHAWITWISDPVPVFSSVCHKASINLKRKTKKQSKTYNVRKHHPNLCPTSFFQTLLDQRWMEDRTQNKRIKKADKLKWIEPRGTSWWWELKTATETGFWRWPQSTQLLKRQRARGIRASGRKSREKFTKSNR